MSPFFIMHLPKLPTIFVKDGEERKAFYTIEAKELIEDGWAEKSVQAPKVTKAEVKVADSPKEEKPVAKVRLASQAKESEVEI